MSIIYTYLLYVDKWRVEWVGKVAIQHDLSEAMSRVLYPIASIGSQVAAPACQSADDSPVRGWDLRGQPFGIEPKFERGCPWDDCKQSPGVSAEKPDTWPVHEAWEHRRLSSLRSTD